MNSAIDCLQEENRALREQIGARRLRFADDQRRRLAAKARTLGRRLLREFAIVTPDTLLAWHRTLVAKRYDGSARRGPGRPPFISEIRALIVRMATENRGWGYTRIQGALANLNHDVSEARSPVVRKNSRRAPVGSCGPRLETILVVQSAENCFRDHAMTITNLMAAGE